jgi:hypothetical protein
MRKLLLLVALLFMASGAHADSSEPSHSCRKPHAPISPTSKWEWDNFRDDVDRYKRCIKDFVQEQQDAIENHKRAAEEAIDEWNRFVRYELN